MTEVISPVAMGAFFLKVFPYVEFLDSGSRNWKVVKETMKMLPIFVAEDGDRERLVVDMAIE